MKVLGISCYYHDSAAAILVDGEIVAAAQEERFTRKKHDAGFPHEAVKYCLAEAGIPAGQGPDIVVFYEKPLLTFHRLLETYFSVAPKGVQSFLQALPVWMTDKLWIEPNIKDSLAKCGIPAPEQIYFPEHHESHAASAFYPSPFDEAAVLTLDGVGEWACATISVGEGSKLRILEQLDFPHSLGLLYSAVTYFCGFKVNSGEYKLMGLAPYGKPIYADTMRDKLLDIKEDGSFRLKMEYFGYLDDLKMTNDRFAALFGGPARDPESKITRREMDLAASIQFITEELVLKIARHARELTGKRFLCLAGGVALNCVANGKLLRSGIFDDIWIQPAAGDAGGALGCALSVWHNTLGKERVSDDHTDKMRGSYLGPSFSNENIRAYLDAHGYIYTELSDAEWAPKVAEVLAGENVVGLLQGRMEYGPRSLGGRSIIGDARSPKMQSVMNQKIKYRESFRPFAPSVLEERNSDYFEIDRPSPYMLLVAPVRKERCIPLQGDEDQVDELLQVVNRLRSDIPSVTHVDYSARIQTVSASTNPRYHAVISEFEKLTGYGVVINTSFNVRGEPIVCTPEDAFRCFMRTEMDYLVLENLLLHKKDQPKWQDKENWREVFVLD